ncbi:uncharacterized protein [Antedon mediterranea]|uniref:uncharacterized protein n=1 Tax=Antedon mediterranea TaxID=105859 RepID=UPI003AF42A18
MASVHLPFCDVNCSYEHCPLLICVMNTNRQNMTELSVCIQSYKTRGWKISDNIPDPCKDFQYPLLHWACALGKYSMVKWLIKEGFDPNLQTEAGDTALHRAIISLRLRLHNKLQIRGLDSTVDLLSGNLSLANVNRQTPMLLLAHSLLKKEISVEYFSHWMICCTDTIINITPDKRSVMTDAQDHDGNTVLHLMVKQPGILPSIRRMMNASASLNIRNKWGQTALDIASLNKSEDYVQNLTIVAAPRWPCLVSKGDSSMVRTSPRLQVPTSQMDVTLTKGVIAVSSPKKRLNSNRDTASVANASPAEPVVTKRSRKNSPHRRVAFDNLRTHLPGTSQIEEARNNMDAVTVTITQSCIKCELEDNVEVTNPAATSYIPESTSYTNDAVYSPDDTTSDSSGFFEYLKISPGFKKEIVEKLEQDKQQFQAIINQEETIRLVEESELKEINEEKKISEEKIVYLLGQVERLQNKSSDLQKSADKLKRNSTERLEKVTKIKNKLLVCMKTMKELEQDNGKS